MSDSLFSRIPILSCIFRLSSTDKATSSGGKTGIAGRDAEAVEPTFPRHSAQASKGGFIAFLSRVCKAAMPCFGPRTGKSDGAAKGDSPHAVGGRVQTDDEIWSDISEPEEEDAARSRSGNGQSASASRSAASCATDDSPIGQEKTRPWTMPKKYGQSVMNLEELKPKSPFDEKQVQLLQTAVAKTLKKWEEEAKNDKLPDDAAACVSDVDVDTDGAGTASCGPAPEHAPADASTSAGQGASAPEPNDPGATAAGVSPTVAPDRASTNVNVYAHTGQSEKICLSLAATLARSVPTESFSREKLDGPYGAHTMLIHKNGYTMDPTWKTLLLAGCSRSALAQRKAALENLPPLLEGTPASVRGKVDDACRRLGMSDDERTSVISYYVDLL